MSETNSLKREIILILVGAIIAATTAYLTTSFNAKREDKKSNIQKRLELNDQLSKDLGKRLFLTYAVYKMEHDKDTTLLDPISKYRQSKEDWNIKFYSYQSLLRHYYGNQINVEFLKNVYYLLVELGQAVEYNKTDTLFRVKYIEPQKRNIEFISKIYDLTEE